MKIGKKFGPFLEQKKLVRATAPIIIDAGANVGQTTERYLRVFPRARIHAFEPNPPIFAKLRKAHGRKRNVVLNQLALGAKEEMADLLVGNHPGTSSLLPKNELLSPAWRFNSSVPVDVTTLDDYTRTRAINRINILKMDLQGYELEALHGGARLLSHRKIDIVFLEVMYKPLYLGAPKASELHAFLIQAGFRLHSRYEQGKSPTFGDWLYVS
jgi:FkbM family methyltransferase